MIKVTPSESFSDFSSRSWSNVTSAKKPVRLSKKNEGGKPSAELATAIDKKFTSFDEFKKKLSEASAKVFGSGWGWLVLNGKELEITSTPNQDSPISKHQVPLLGIDVWEHSYYLKHQNRRPQYIEAFWSVVNWDYVGDRYKKAMA